MKNFLAGSFFYIKAGCCLLFVFWSALYASAQSSVSIGAGINQPVQSGFGIGWEAGLQYNIKLADKLYIDPALSYAELNPANNFQTRNWKLYKFGLGGKYYLSNPFFVRAGAFVQLEKDSYLNTGGQIGALIGAGYDIPLSGRNLLEVSARSDFWRPTHHEFRPILGLAVAYKFRFADK
ncbi:hypothetical protein [Mucilaginibacter sp.]|uniref:hypothetical protein n=1 Tax=Mucilaginibacter sp. TaxID=1882438 RepID=UPI0035BC9753